MILRWEKPMTLGLPFDRLPRSKRLTFIGAVLVVGFIALFWQLARRAR